MDLNGCEWLACNFCCVRADSVPTLKFYICDGCNHVLCYDCFSYGLLSCRGGMGEQSLAGCVFCKNLLTGAHEVCKAMAYSVQFTFCRADELMTLVLFEFNQFKRYHDMQATLFFKRINESHKMIGKMRAAVVEFSNKGALLKKRCSALISVYAKQEEELKRLRAECDRLLKINRASKQPNQSVSGESATACDFEKKSPYFSFGESSEMNTTLNASILNSSIISGLDSSMMCNFAAPGLLDTSFQPPAKAPKLSELGAISSTLEALGKGDTKPGSGAEFLKSYLRSSEGLNVSQVSNYSESSVGRTAICDMVEKFKVPDLPPRRNIFNSSFCGSTAPIDAVDGHSEGDLRFRSSSSGTRYANSVLGTMPMSSIRKEDVGGLVGARNVGSSVDEKTRSGEKVSPTAPDAYSAIPAMNKNHSFTLPSTQSNNAIGNFGFPFDKSATQTMGHSVR